MDGTIGAASVQPGTGSPRPAADVLREIGRGGRLFRDLVVTRNARVMVSVGAGGHEIRLNACFLDAPSEVLRSVGAMYSGGRAREVRAARDRVRAFLAALPRTRPPARIRRRAARRPGDAVILSALRAEFERVNREFFDGALPSIPIALSGRMTRRNGHFSTAPLEIVISRRLCEHASDGEADATLRHEMIHLWQHVSGRRPGHGPDFRACARRIGVHPRATRQVDWR